MSRHRTTLLARRRHRRAPVRRPLLAGALAAALALGAGARVALRRRSAGARADQPAPVVPGPPSEAPAAETVEETWSCECGQEYRVQGEDRHRVYWLADAAVSDPVLEGKCPNCERPLPRDHGHGTSSPDGAVPPPAAA